jgi:hypothetical protein
MRGPGCSLGLACITVAIAAGCPVR